MSCNKCGGGGTVKMPCRVCSLLDRDFTIKTVTYCDFCGAYICIPDQTNIIRRAKAALLDIRLKLK